MEIKKTEFPGLVALFFFASLEVMNMLCSEKGFAVRYVCDALRIWSSFGRTLRLTSASR